MLKLSFLMIGAFLACAACGTSVDGGAGGGGESGSTVFDSAQVEAACETHSIVTCAKELECLPDRDKIIGSAETCAERMKVRCISRFALPGTGLTPAGLQACANMLSVDGCGMYADIPAECAFSGQLDVGEVCSDDAQCASRNCSATQTEPCGQCESKPKAVALCVLGCNYSKPGCGYPNPQPGPSCGHGQECAGDHCWDSPEDGEACGYPYDVCIYPSVCAGEICSLELPSCQ